jgi:dethiobiotin synthetase
MECCAMTEVQHSVFVVGTDTDVGKTLVAACLVSAWGADYWKPVQTGAGEDPGDSATVSRLTGLSPSRIHPPRHVYAAPLSPHAAAALEGASIALDDFVAPRTDRPLVIEGAGGVLVPLNESDLMVDLVLRLGFPAVVVARSGLGTINHTLLTLEALRARGVHILGVVMNGPPNRSNRDAVEHYGQVQVIAELPRVEAVSADWVEAMSRRFVGASA